MSKSTRNLQSIRPKEGFSPEQGYEGTMGIATPFRAQVKLLNQMITAHPSSGLRRDRNEDGYPLLAPYAGAALSLQLYQI